MNKVQEQVKILLDSPVSLVSQRFNTVNTIMKICSTPSTKSLFQKHTSEYWMNTKPILSKIGNFGFFLGVDSI